MYTLFFQSLPIGDDSASEIEKVENNLGDGDDFYGDDENVNLLKKLHLCRNKLLYLCQKEKELGKHMNDEVGGENVVSGEHVLFYFVVLLSFESLQIHI